MIEKEFLRKTDKFWQINPSELEFFDEWVEYLESILTGPCTLFSDAKSGKNFLIFIKARVATIRGLKIEIYPNEHTPPHFHVKSPNISATFRIDDCSIINGEIGANDYEKIIYWYKSGAKKLLVEKWNDTRPTNCIVGNYVE